jgi:hypothetical protein
MFGGQCGGVQPKVSARDAYLATVAWTSFPGLNAFRFARSSASRSASDWSSAFTVSSSSTMAVRRTLIVNSFGRGFFTLGSGSLLRCSGLSCFEASAALYRLESSWPSDASAE